MEQSLFDWGNFVLIAVAIIATLALVAWGTYALVKRTTRRARAAANRRSATAHRQ